jgi:hypothetical protein
MLVNARRHRDDLKTIRLDGVVQRVVGVVERRPSAVRSGVTSRAIHRRWRRACDGIGVTPAWFDVAIVRRCAAGH